MAGQSTKFGERWISSTEAGPGGIRIIIYFLLGTARYLTFYSQGMGKDGRN